MPRTLPYSLLDVFADRPLEGNPLCIFHDGRGLSGEAMQALARETNLSETVFVLPSGNPQKDRLEGVAIRIFTTHEELPFAGHPTLGTAAWLRLHHPGLQQAETVTLLCKVGPIAVHFGPQGVGPGLFGTMRQRDPEWGPEYSRGEIAEVLGLAKDDLLPGAEPQSVSTGNPFCIVALRSQAVLSRLRTPQPGATQWLQARGARWFYCVAPGDSTDLWHARMQWESGEDPATGSAAGPCIAWLVRSGFVPSGTSVMLIQGTEIQRRSRLVVQATQVGGSVSGVLVAGRTISVAFGQFVLEQ